MPDFRWRPLPGRFGVSINESSWNNYGIATTVTASATSILFMPMPYGKLAASKCSIALTTAAAGSAAITAQFFKRPAGTTGGSDVALTNTYDLKQTATNKRVDVPLLATLTESQRTFAPEIDPSNGSVQGGDLLIVALVAAGTVTTQPVLVISTELFNLI